MCYSCVIYVLLQVYERMKGEDVTPDVVIDEFYSQYKEEAASVFGEDSDYNDGRKVSITCPKCYQI